MGLELVSLPIFADFRQMEIRFVWIVHRIAHRLRDFLFAELWVKLANLFDRMARGAGGQEFVKWNTGLANSKRAIIVKMNMVKRVVHKNLRTHRHERK